MILYVSDLTYTSFLRLRFRFGPFSLTTGGFSWTSHLVGTGGPCACNTLSPECGNSGVWKMEGAYTLLITLPGRSRLKTIEKSTQKQTEIKTISDSGNGRILTSSSCLWSPWHRANCPHVILNNFKLSRAGMEARGRGPRWPIRFLKMGTEFLSWKAKRPGPSH